MPAAESLDIRITGSASGFAGAAKQVTHEINSIKRAAMDIPKNLVARAGGFFASFLTADFLIGQVRKTLAYADAIDDLSKRAGISAEKFQEWGFALKQVGVSVAALNLPLRTLGLTLARGQRGDKGALAALAALGLKPDLTAEEAFSAIGARLAGRRPTAQEFEAINQALGRTAYTLVPVFADGLGKAEKKARDLGQVMKNNVTAELAAANKEIEIFQNRITIGMGTILGRLRRTWRMEDLIHEIGGPLGGIFAPGKDDLLRTLELEDRLAEALRVRARKPPTGGDTPLADAAKATAAPAFHLAADALARIGLFRGGAGADPAQRVRTAQLAELKKIVGEQKGLRSDMGRLF